LSIPLIEKIMSTSSIGKGSPENSFIGKGSPLKGYPRDIRGAYHPLLFGPKGDPFVGDIQDEMQKMFGNAATTLVHFRNWGSPLETTDGPKNCKIIMGPSIVPGKYDAGAAALTGQTPRAFDVPTPFKRALLIYHLDRHREALLQTWVDKTKDTEKAKEYNDAIVAFIKSWLTVLKSAMEKPHKEPRQKKPQKTQKIEDSA